MKQSDYPEAGFLGGAAYPATGFYPLRVRLFDIRGPMN